MLVKYIIVLILEILYYSLFMKFARPEGKLWKYVILFVILTISNLLTNTSQLLTYLLFLVICIYGLKYIVKLKTSLYDMLIIVIMLLIKLAIETPIYLILTNYIDIYTNAIITGIIKLALIVLFRNKLNIMYDKLKLKWKRNNFYIRYIFSILMFIYSILSIIFILLYYVK